MTGTIIAPRCATLERLGSRPVINACGIYTDLGGSRLSPTVWAAMTEVNHHFVKMVDLLESSGQVIARRLGAEAGRVTPGAAASIALMVSAAMTGTDGEAGQRLPDTRGLKNEIVLQHNHRYKYDRQITMTGAKLVLPGDERGTSLTQLEAAVGPTTAALFVPAHLDSQRGTVPLRDVVAIGRRRGLPVLVDAAYRCWPLEAMSSYSAAGADLVCFSAKYFGGPNAGGFIVGTRRLIDAVSSNDFTRYESGRYQTFGRPFKMDRQTIVGVVLALEEWLTMDHAARWARYARQVAELRRYVEGLPGVRATSSYFTMDERLVPDPVNSLVVELSPASRRTVAGVAQALEQGSPAVLCVVDGEKLVFCMDVIHDDEVELVGAQLRSILAG